MVLSAADGARCAQEKGIVALPKSNHTRLAQRRTHCYIKSCEIA
jgi:hypothetical protein